MAGMVTTGAQLARIADFTGAYPRSRLADETRR